MGPTQCCLARLLPLLLRTTHLLCLLSLLQKAQSQQSRWRCWKQNWQLQNIVSMPAAI